MCLAGWDGWQIGEMTFLMQIDYALCRSQIADAPRAEWRKFYVIKTHSLSFIMPTICITLVRSLNCVKLPSVLLQLSPGPQNCSPHFTPWSAVTVRNFLVRSLPLRRSAGPQVRSPHFTPGQAFGLLRWFSLYCIALRLNWHVTLQMAAEALCDYLQYLAVLSSLCCWVKTTLLK